MASISLHLYHTALRCKEIPVRIVAKIDKVIDAEQMFTPGYALHAIKK